ncbi:MAG: hypothetical protein R3F49_20410 [Planctomycetota bacterium]
MSLSHDQLSAALERVINVLMEAVRKDADAAREFEASVPVFFAGAPPVTDPQAAMLAARRHAEWFLIERHSPALVGAPADRLLGEARQALAASDHPGTARDSEDAEALEVALDGFLASTTGAFEVEEVRASEGAWLRDLSGLAQYALLAPELSLRLTTGDLLVGRLYPVGDGLHVASPAAAVFRGEGLVAAYQRDLTRLRQGPGAKVLRLAQAELERMFFGPVSYGGGAAPTSAVPDVRATVAAGREWLLAHDLEPQHVESILARLAAMPLDGTQIVPGLGDAVGEVLEELAFDTSIDLRLARARLIELGRAFALDQANVLASPDPGATSPVEGPGPVTSTPGAERKPLRQARSNAHLEGAPNSDEARAKAVDEFARNRAAGADALAELAALRVALGLGEDGEDVEEEDAPAPDFPGVVGAMVHEFVWETSVTAGEAAARELAPLAHLATFAEPIGVFEELAGRDLVRFASFWVIERGVVRDADAARALLAALRRFGEWCRDAHEHDVMGALEPALDGLDASLPRVVEANAEVREAPALDGSEAGDVFEVVDDSAAVLRALDGNELPLAIDPRVRARLAAGDRVRGRAASGVLEVVRIYPPEAVLSF